MKCGGLISSSCSRKPHGKAGDEERRKMPRLSTSSMARFCFYTRFEKRVKSDIKLCFSAEEPRVVYSTNELLSATNKHVLPGALQESNMIYQFSCHCDNRYVGRIFQRLQDRIKQHVPKSIRSCSSSQKRVLPARRCKSSIQTDIQSFASDLTIELHLLQNPTCAQHYDDSRSSILAQGRYHFHLSLLKATVIKTSNPALSRQKEFISALLTFFHWSFFSQSLLGFFQ